MTEAGQDPSTFPIAKRVYIVVDDDVTRAREHVDAGLTQIYGSSSLNAVAVYGSPASCIAGLREVAEAGAELIQLHPLFDETGQLERLAREVVSALPNT
jgi:alkanesulfonate monooxygenase SsuD/methylene tetrahydromethanopterin reductase-like flavin-dependent oxidoreductase (luciferase family)